MIGSATSVASTPRALHERPAGQREKPKLDRGAQWAMDHGCTRVLTEDDKVIAGREAVLAAAREANRGVVEFGKKASRGRTAGNALVAAHVGGLGAMALLGPVGLGLGAVAGCLYAWNRYKTRDTGTVTVEIDGERRTTPFYFQPKAWLRTDRELAIEEGYVGDRIRPKLPQPIIGADSRALEGQRARLRELSQARRLVADLGLLSDDGVPSVQQVDAQTAMDLMASGGRVYALTATHITDVPHKMKVVASNEAKNQRVEREITWIERKLDYQLAPLCSARSVEQVKQGSGLPTGLLGVYRDAGSYAEHVAFRRDEEGLFTFERGGFLEGDMLNKVKTVTRTRSSESRSRDRSVAI